MMTTTPQPDLQFPQLRVARPRPMSEPIRWTPDSGERVHTIHNLPARTKHIPTVTCIFGRRGQGKTLLADTMAEQRQRRFELLGMAEQHRLYSNFWMAAADRSKQEIVEELQEFPAWLNDSPFSTLVIDEVAELLPSLRPMSNDNLLTMGFLKQIRKRGVSVIMATQYPQEVTTGILRQCDWFILSQAVQAGRHLRTYWWDWPGNITGNWGRKYFPPERDTHDFAFLYQNTYRMFGRYRTEEIIAPRFADRREAIRAEQEQMRLDAQRGEPADVPAEVAAAAAAATGAHFPPGVQAIIDDAAGSGIGVVWIEEIAEKLRIYYKKPTATIQQITGRLRAYGAQVTTDQGEAYLLYEPR